jgi:uncharacterized membrane protein YidH (DUF202 family)
VPESKSPSSLSSQVSDFVSTTKAYAKQETVGPLKHAARSLGLGLAGSFLIAFGLFELLLGLLRWLQHQFHGNVSFLPYLITLVVAVVVVAVTAVLIARHPLSKSAKKGQ